MRLAAVLVSAVILFAGSYYLIRWLGGVLNRKAGFKKEDIKEPECKVLIASDDPDLTERADAVLEKFREKNPAIKISFSYDNCNNMLEKLVNGRYALLLLKEEQLDSMQQQEAGLSSKKLKDIYIPHGFYVVWNPGLKINGRNRVMNALEFAVLDSFSGQ